jgi:polysaccharide biosynthesis/export protein VpsN
MKYLTTFFAVAVLAGCASHKPQQQVAAPASPLLSHRTVTIVETNPVVFISGEVLHPGRFMWTSGLTLTNAIVLAGGFTDFADKSQLQIRHCNGTVEKYSYQQTNSPLLEQSDVVHVGRRFF